MEAAPKIRRALPQRRYLYGDYQVTVLGDVDSADERTYLLIAAFVRDGETQPRLYVVAERVHGGIGLRVIGASMDEVLDVDPRWANIGAFVDQALQTGSQLLGLEQETAYPLG